MNAYLVSISVNEQHADSVEYVIRTAVSFCENRGVERKEVGTFIRLAPKGKTTEVVRLALLETSIDASATDVMSYARKLESALRSTLSAAGAKGGEVRVCVRAANDAGVDE